MRNFTKQPGQRKQVNSSTDTTRIPVPYNKYFEIDPPTKDADLLPGDRIEDYNCTFLAYLAPKPEYEDTLDMWPVLTDLLDYPVCDLVAGRLYPITPEDIHRHLGDTEYLVESSTSTKQFTKHPRASVTASKADKWYICPECHNKTVVPMYPDNTPLIDEGEVFICNECGAEFEAHPLYNGEVKFTLPFNEYVQRHGPGGPDDLTDDDYDYWYSRWEAYVDSVKRRVNSAKTIKASTKKPMSFEEYCQATWGLAPSKLTSDDKKKAEEEYHRVTKQPVDSAEETTRKQDRRLSPTSVRYKGYLIVLDRGGDGYNIYDKHRELEDAGHPSVESAKKCVDEIIRESSVTAAQDSGTYWMAKYKDMNGNLHKIVFQFDSQDFDEAEEEMDAVIPEPYTAGRLLGRCNPELAEKDGFVVLSSQNIHCAEEIEDYEDDIQEISQEFTSENTSINSGKLPAIFKLIHLAPGTINIDYGGGKFDNVAEYLAPMDVINLVYDPYNRTPEHNREVIRTVKKAGGADSATCSNVLNVIKEPEVRRNVLENIRRLVKPEGVVYITVYEGSGRGNEGPTKSGYQLNRKTADYLAEIQEVFPDAMRKGKLIIAHPNGSAVTSAEDLSYDALTCEDCTYDLWTLVQDDRGEWVREDKIDTYDDYDTARAEATALAKDTPCQLIEVGPDGLLVAWTSRLPDKPLPFENSAPISSSSASKQFKVTPKEVKAASYGRAYDIADDDYFSKDELMEFAYSLEPIIQHLADDEDSGSIVEVSDVYLNGNKLGVAFMIDGAEHSGEVRIDKRRVKWVRDLYKYVTPLFEQIADSFWDYVRPEATDDQRSTWMDIWKDIHLPSYLSELTSSTKAKGQTVEAALVETPQEVVDSLIRILDQYEFTLDPAFETNPGKTWMGAVHLQVINETSHVPAGDFTALRDNVPKALIDAIHDLEDSSNCPITWSFGVNKNGQVTAGLDIMEQYVSDEDEREMDEYDQSDRDWEYVESSNEFDNYDREVKDYNIYAIKKDGSRTLVKTVHGTKRDVESVLNGKYSYLPKLSFVKKIEVRDADTDEVESATNINATSSGRKHSIKTLHDNLLNRASQLMRNMGYPLSEIADYLVVEVNPAEEGWISCEVRAELDYDGMEQMIEVLNPIVKKYDKEAYFDHVTGGIIESYLSSNNFNVYGSEVVEAGWGVDDYPEPPDYDDPEEYESVEYITIDLDDDIIVRANTVDFLGSPKFEKDEDGWFVDEYPEVQLDDSGSVAERALDLMTPQLPAEPGIYRVRGRIHLAYDVMIPVYYDSYGPDDEEYFVDSDNVKVDFNFKKSSIENLEVGKD